MLELILILNGAEHVHSLNHFPLIMDREDGLLRINQIHLLEDHWKVSDMGHIAVTHLKLSVLGLPPISTISVAKTSVCWPPWYFRAYEIL
jgi:hypothetical protein